MNNKIKEMYLGTFNEGLDKDWIDTMFANDLSSCDGCEHRIVEEEIAISAINEERSDLGEKDGDNECEHGELDDRLADCYRLILWLEDYKAFIIRIT